MSTLLYDYYYRRLVAAARSVGFRPPRTYQIERVEEIRFRHPNRNVLVISQSPTTHKQLQKVIRKLEKLSGARVSAKFRERTAWEKFRDFMGGRNAQNYDEQLEAQHFIARERERALDRLQVADSKKDLSFAYADAIILQREHKRFGVEYLEVK